MEILENESKEIFSTQGRLTECKYCGHKFRNQEIRIINEIQKIICPNCNTEYCNKIETERDLFILQDIFLASGKNEKKLEDLIKILYPYSQSMLLKFFKPAIRDNEILLEYANSVVQLCVIEYYKDENFKFKDSFSGFIYNKCKEAIYGNKNLTIAGKFNKKGIDVISLNYLFEDGNQVEYADLKYNFYEHIENEHDKYLMINYITDLLFAIGDYASSTYEKFFYEVGIYLYFTQGEKKAEKFFSSVGREGKYLFLYSLEILKKELSKMCNIKIME